METTPFQLIYVTLPTILTYHKMPYNIFPITGFTYKQTKKDSLTNRKQIFFHFIAEIIVE